jgi:hypothetical protein
LSRIPVPENEASFVPSGIEWRTEPIGVGYPQQVLPVWSGAAPAMRREGSRFCTLSLATSQA